MYVFIKLIFTAFVVVLISEIAKRSTVFAGIVASIPPVSYTHLTLPTTPYV